MSGVAAAGVRAVRCCVTRSVNLLCVGSEDHCMDFFSGTKDKSMDYKVRVVRWTFTNSSRKHYTYIQGGSFD